MQFIKNKTTNKANLLVTSSLLILNGNMCYSFNKLPAHKDIDAKTPTYNRKLYDKGYESGYESKEEYENDYKEEPIYEEVDYGKIGASKEKKVLTYSSELKDDGYLSDNREDLEEHIYEELYDKPSDKKEHIYDQVAPDSEGPEPNIADNPIRSRLNKEEILNIRPKQKKEAIQPVKLVNPELEAFENIVHKYIPLISNLSLIESLEKIQNTINMIVYMRTKDDDSTLTEELKTALRKLKIKLKQVDSPCFVAVEFYRKTSEAISRLTNNAQVLKQEYSKERLQEANKIKEKISGIVKEVNDLIDLLKIQPNNYKKNRATKFINGIPYTDL